jgi:hypothetical protein
MTLEQSPREDASIYVSGVRGARESGENGVGRKRGSASSGLGEVHFLPTRSGLYLQRAWKNQLFFPHGQACIYPGARPAPQGDVREMTLQYPLSGHFSLGWVRIGRSKALTHTARTEGGNRSKLHFQFGQDCRWGPNSVDFTMVRPAKRAVPDARLCRLTAHPYSLI